MHIMSNFVAKFEGTYRADIRHVFFRALLAVTFLILLVPPLQAQVADGKRMALVIGNGAYKNVPELKNPRNDSSDIAAALKAVGFEVLLHTDQTQGSMLDTLRGFRRSASGAEIALIYFAGHGIEIDRQNYLIPVDAVLETDSDINFEAVPLETMIFAAGGATRLSMVIVDACRNNPFAASIKRVNSSRSIGRGLSAVEPTKNTLVAYAAKEGTTAADGVGRNSPYASALIASLGHPNLEVGLMMRRVRDEVLNATAGAQEPFVYGSLSAEQIFLNDTRGLSPVESEANVVTEPNASAAEIAFWQSISGNSETSELQNYLDLYPNGLFTELARARLNKFGEVAPRQEDPFSPLVPESNAPERDSGRELTRSEIVELQERLSAIGHSLGSADGIAGRRTESAIREFEAAENLPISGQPTLPVYYALRDRVSDSDLENWRSKRAARARTTNVTPARPKVVTPEPKTAETESSAGPSPAFRQFCASNRQCGTSQCIIGSSGKSWRKNRSCQYCPLYASRCK